MQLNKKGMGGLALIMIMAAAVVVIAGGVFLGTKFSSGEGFSIAADDDAVGAFDFTGYNVKADLEVANQYTGSAVAPTIYVYDEEPANWGNGRVDAQSGYVDTGTATSGAYTIQELCGDYHVRAILSGYYDEHFVVSIPCSGDVNMNDYNAEPPVTKVKMNDIDTLSISNVDLAISTNETSDITYTKVASITIDSDEHYVLDEIKMQEDATYSFATDSDGNGVYDEGINKIEVTIGYGSQTQKWIPFDVSASKDEFAGSDVATLDYSLDIPEESTFSIQFKVTCDATLDATGDADGKCGDGEDFLDSVILVDAKGNTATFDITG